MKGNGPAAKRIQIDQDTMYDLPGMDYNLHI